MLCQRYHQHRPRKRSNALQAYLFQTYDLSNDSCLYYERNERIAIKCMFTHVTYGDTFHSFLQNALAYVLAF
jgi:hypothetical protein